MKVFLSIIRLTGIYIVLRQLLALMSGEPFVPKLLFLYLLEGFTGAVIVQLIKHSAFTETVTKTFGKKKDMDSR